MNVRRYSKKVWGRSHTGLAPRKTGTCLQRCIARFGPTRNEVSTSDDLKLVREQLWWGRERMPGSGPCTQRKNNVEEKSVKLCECGCGKPAPIATKNIPDRGWVKGQPTRFISKHNLGRRTESPSWRGGQTVSTAGRVCIYNPSHHRSQRQGYVFQSILVAEKALGKPIPPPIEIHHVNSDKGNDKNINLVVCEDRAYHMLLHQRKRAYDACGNGSWLKCWICKNYDTQPHNIS